MQLSHGCVVLSPVWVFCFELVVTVPTNRPVLQSITLNLVISLLTHDSADTEALSAIHQADRWVHIMPALSVFLYVNKI